MRGRPRVRVASLAAVVGLVLCATVAAGSWLMGPVEWNDSDSLFYEAQRLELLGRTAHEARFEVFSSDKAQSVAINEDDADPPHVLNPTWVEYSHSSTGVGGPYRSSGRGLTPHLASTAWRSRPSSAI